MILRYQTVRQDSAKAVQMRKCFAERSNESMEYIYYIIRIRMYLKHPLEGQ